MRAAAAETWSVPDPDCLVSAPGTQSLIGLLPLLRPESAVAVVGPTYDEHESSFARAGHRVEQVAELAKCGDAQVAIVVNPNNPDGRRHDPETLCTAADRLAARGGLLVVDEAFVDLDPDLSVAGSVRPGLLVLRGIGKFFGLAGLRLGFAVAEPRLAALLRQALGPWAASGPALVVGRAALLDRAWAAEVRRRLAVEAGLLDQVLRGAGLAVVGGTDLFRLANAPRAWAIYEHLGRQGVLVRPFAEQPRWLRFGLPPDAAGRARLAEALASAPR